MLSALGGADALEIIVSLKNLTGQGFASVRSEIAKTEARANATNLGGFSKAAKTAETDAEKAAGKGGGSGIGLLGSAFGGLINPVTLAIGAVAGVTGVLTAAEDTYQHIEQLQEALAVAAKDHGISLGVLQDQVTATTKTAQQWGFTEEDILAATTKLTEAGMSLADQQAAMPSIMDLARAKNLDLAEAARMYELALMGNTRAVKDLGIALPHVTDAEKVHDAAQKQVETDTNALTNAQNSLQLMELSLAGKHHLTAAEALRLQLAHQKVSEATAKLHADTEKLNAVQGTAADRAARLQMLNQDLTKAIGDQRTAVTPMQVAQTKLSDAWEKFATTVGPGVEKAFTAIIGAVATLIGWLADLFDWLGRVIGGLGKLGQSVVTNLGGVSTGGMTNAQFMAGLGKHAEGGWVGLHGPEIGLLGEREPEFIIPQSKLGAPAGPPGGSHITLNVGFIAMPSRSQIAELADLIERELGSRFALRGTSARLGFGA